MQIENEARCEILVLPGYDGDGRESVTVLAKGTYSLEHGETPEPLGPEDRLPFVMADEFWGEPGASAVKYEAEVAPFKPFADLVLLGHAYDPRGRATKGVNVEFEVDGNRHAAKVTSSEALDAIPLHFLERPSGGPNWLRTNRPRSGFGFYPKNFRPRVDYAGTYDEAWESERSPFLPEDFDYRFFQSAFPSLIRSRYLAGGESLRIVGACDRGRIDSAVPRIGIDVEVFQDADEQRHPAHLDTLVALPDLGKLVMIWRLMLVTGRPPSTLRGFRIRERIGGKA